MVKDVMNARSDTDGSDTSLVSASAFDAIAHDLQQLRHRAGGVSYADIAARISARRRTEGASEAAARIARSTVYDAFRNGRQRVNPELVVEIALALGVVKADADGWRERCLSANLGTAPPAATTSTVAAKSDVSGAAQHSATPPATSPHVLHRSLMIAVMLSCIGLNFIGGALASKFELMLFLDMIGTAVAAIALGPWHGVVVAVTTNGVLTLAANPESLPFTLVNVVGALVWGYGYQRFAFFRQPLGFLLLSIIVALACTLTAVPINLLVFGGVVAHASDGVASALVAGGQALWLAIFSANMLASVADKLIAGSLAFVANQLLKPIGLRSVLAERPN